MKRFVVLWILLLGLGLFGWWKIITDQTPLAQILPAISPTPTKQVTPAVTTSDFLFVPYWSLSGKNVFPLQYTTLLYFGISADKNGIVTTDSGYTSLAAFNLAAQGRDRLLVVRMLNADDNSSILKDTKVQQKIIDESIRLATTNRFSGVVADLEMSALPFDSLVQSISSFHNRFSLAAKAQNLTYGITMYGDVFYRVRPFDMSYLSKIADTIYVLAYDFHKANGSPGPNFPLNANPGEYSLKGMVQDYSKVSSLQKLVIVLGMFGYDWTVDSKGNPTGTATAISYDNIRQQFTQNCQKKNCLVQQDKQSAETMITYMDAVGKHHVIWFTDQEELKTKQQFLQLQGISNFSYWAYGYF